MKTEKTSFLLALMAAACFAILAASLYYDSKAGWSRLDQRQELDDRWYEELEKLRLLETRLYDLGRVDHFWEYSGDKKKLWQEAISAKQNAATALSEVRSELRNVRGRFSNEDGERESLQIAREVLDNLAERENQRLEWVIQELKKQEDPK